MSVRQFGDTQIRTTETSKNATQQPYSFHRAPFHGQRYNTHQNFKKPGVHSRRHNKSRRYLPVLTSTRRYSAVLTSPNEY